MDFKNLDNTTRQFMLKEFELDNSKNSIYISPRLNSSGQKNFATLLKAAISEGDSNSLTIKLRLGNYFNAKEISHRNGKPYAKSVPDTAANTLAESEFNRFYIRGLCLRAIEANGQLKIYRARESTYRRVESESVIGRTLNAKALLEDLRNSIGKAPTILPDINSGLSVELI